MSLFRRILLTLWPKRREDSPIGEVVIPTPDGSICLVAGGAFIIGLDLPGSAHTISPLAGGAHTIGQGNPGESHTIAASAGGSHTIGQAVKGAANCDC